MYEESRIDYLNIDFIYPWGEGWSDRNIYGVETYEEKQLTSIENDGIDNWKTKIVFNDVSYAGKLYVGGICEYYEIEDAKKLEAKEQIAAKIYFTGSYEGVLTFVNAEIVYDIEPTEYGFNYLGIRETSGKVKINDIDITDKILRRNER